MSELFRDWEPYLHVHEDWDHIAYMRADMISQVIGQQATRSAFGDIDLMTGETHDDQEDPHSI